MGMFVRSRRCRRRLRRSLVRQIKYRNTSDVDHPFRSTVGFSLRVLYRFKSQRESFPHFPCLHSHTEQLIKSEWKDLLSCVSVCVCSCACSCGIEKLCHRSFCFSLPRCTDGGTQHSQTTGKHKRGEEKLTLFYARTSFVDFLGKKKNGAPHACGKFVSYFLSVHSFPYPIALIPKSERKVKYLEV